MADVALAFLFTMKNEDSSLGGSVIIDNNGGEVRFGVNSEAHPEATRAGFYTMSKQEAWEYAKKIYTKDYWDLLSGSAIKSQEIAEKIVDLAFNMGISRMTRVTQRAINFVNGESVLEVDGKMGPLTVAQINSLDSGILLYAIKSYAKQRYEDIVRAHPEDQKYLKGWLRRVDV